MEGYDGSVTIKTQLDNKQMLKGIEDVKKVVDDLINRVKQMGQIASAKIVTPEATQNVMALNDAYAKQEQIVQRLQEEIDRLSQTQTKTAEYTDLEGQIAKTDKQLDAYVAKIDKMIALYGESKVEGMKSFQSLQYDFERLQELYDQLIARQQEMQANGTAFVPADTTALQQKLIEAQERQSAILGRLAPQYREVREEVRKTGNEAVKAHKEAAKQTGINFNKIVKYTFGVRSLFVLYRRLRQAAGEALKTIAQGDPEFNAAMSRLMTSWNQLKADLGTMLQPIVQSVIPVLTYVLEKLHNALMTVSKVIATIVGQDYIDKVTVQTVDYAGALDSVATSAKEAKKQLGGYDKLNVISGGESGGFSGISAALKAQEDFGDKTDDNTHKVEKEKAAIEQVQWAVESAFDVIMGYQDAFEKDGFLGIVKQFGKNLKEVFNDPDTFGVEFDDTKPLGRLARDLKERISPSGELVREGKSLKEWFNDLVVSDRATSREWTDEDEAEWQAKKLAENFKKSLDKSVRDVNLAEWIASGGKDNLKKLGKDLKAFAKKTAKAMHDEYVNNGGTDLSEQFKDSVKDGLDSVADLGRGMKRTILALFGFSDAEIDAMMGDAEDAVEKVSKGVDNSAARLGRSARDEVIKGWMYTDGQKQDIETRTSALATYNLTEQKAAQNLGSKIAEAVSSAINYTSAESAQVTENTKKLINGASSVKATAESVGKSLGNSLSSKLRESVQFTEQDGKNAANELAKGMEAVSAEANRGGSVLNSALQEVGKRISEGINRGTISVPVSFTGQATPVSTQANYNNQKINTSVSIYLDKKEIANAVFEEAAQLQKQVGNGIAAAIQYAVSMS